MRSLATKLTLQSDKYILTSVSDADREIPTRAERIMPETRFTEFPALSVDPRVGISRFALETDVFFLSMTLKFIIIICLFF